MNEFERKLIQGIHDDKWAGKITGFRSRGGVREYPMEPDDQDVNPDRNVPVTVFTADALAAHDREVAAEALRQAAVSWRSHWGSSGEDIEAWLCARADTYQDKETSE